MFVPGEDEVGKVLAEVGLGVEIQGFEHGAETAEIPAYAAVGGVAGAEEAAARFAFVGADIRFNMGVAQSAERVVDVGLLEPEFSGLLVLLFSFKIAGTASAHVDGKDRMVGVTAGDCG